MLRSFFIIVTCLSALSVMGQTKLTSEQEKQVLAKMEKSSNALRTLQCDFVQSKRMKLLSKEMQSKCAVFCEARQDQMAIYDTLRLYVYHERRQGADQVS